MKASSERLERRMLRPSSSTHGMGAGAISGVCRFEVEASARVGGGPSRLSIERSAIGSPQYVDQRLNELVGFPVQRRETGFCDGAAMVLSLAVGRAGRDVTLDRDVAGLLQVHPRRSLFCFGQHLVDGKQQPALRNARLHQFMEDEDRRLQVVEGGAGRLHYQVRSLRDPAGALAGTRWRV